MLCLPVSPCIYLCVCLWLHLCFSDNYFSNRYVQLWSSVPCLRNYLLFICLEIALNPGQDKVQIKVPKTIRGNKTFQNVYK